MSQKGRAADCALFAVCGFGQTRTGGPPRLVGMASEKLEGLHRGCFLDYPATCCAALLSALEPYGKAQRELIDERDRPATFDPKFGLHWTE